MVVLSAGTCQDWVQPLSDPSRSIFSNYSSILSLLAQYEGRTLNVVCSERMWVYWDMMLCCWISGSIYFEGVQEEVPFFLDCLILKDKGIVFEMLGITHPVTQLDIPGDLNSPQHGCENLKPSGQVLY